MNFPSNSRLQAEIDLLVASQSELLAALRIACRHLDWHMPRSVGEHIARAENIARVLDSSRSRRSGIEEEAA